MSSLLKWSLITLASTVLATPLSTPHDTQPFRSAVALAPLLAGDHPHGTVNNSYIVMLKKDLPPSLMDNHFGALQRVHDADPLFSDRSGVQQVYDGHIKGYSGYFSESVVDKLRAMPEVAYIEKDQIVRTLEMQKASPWGLARISHRSKLTFNTFTKYLFDADGGEGVDVYVIDTGINIGHVEFEGRALWGKTVPLNTVDDDDNGHGTHCAGTIASRKYGVAKKANVIAVKVLDGSGSGSMSDVIGGIVFAAKEAGKKRAVADAEVAATGKTKHKGSVANLSLGSGKSRATDDAVDGAVESGLNIAVAAGNDNQDACNYSPAASKQAVTVGASTLGDERAYFSNYGKCVDVFAPGLNILSTYKGGNTSVSTLSGTSMASPHTAGLLAYLLSIYPSKHFDPSFDDENNLVSLQSQHVFEKTVSVYAITHAALPRWISSLMPAPDVFKAMAAPVPAPRLSPAQLKKALIALASKGVLSDLPSLTPNLLIFNNMTMD